jgi:hypothetical protein
MFDLKKLLSNLDYEVVACLIHKDRHVAMHGSEAPDPYELGLQMVVERFCFEIGDVENGGIIYAEKRRHDLDLHLDVAWEALRASGTHHLNMGQIDKRIVGLSLKAKSVNIAGLQLADLVVSAIGRHAMGRDGRDFYSVVHNKMCSEDGNVEGYGFVTLPR